MEMLDILRNELKEGMSISKVKELSNKYNITFAYKGMEASAELLKTCVPGAANEVCRKTIDTAISTMYMNAGDLSEAKKWLDGEYWNAIDEIAIENTNRILLLSQLSYVPITTSKQVSICICKDANIDEVVMLQKLNKLSEINSCLGMVAEQSKVFRIEASADSLVVYATKISQ